MSDGPLQHGRGGRRILLALALLCIASLGVVFYLYSGQATWPPRGFVGHGELNDPPIPLPNMALALLGSGPAGAASARAAVYTDFDFFRHKWTFLYWGQGLCPERCRAILETTRQVRSALDRDMDRLQRVFIADGACCEMDFLHTQPDLITVRAGSDASPLLALLSRADHANATVADRIYLIDPSGRLVISYAPDARLQDLLADLKYLMGSFRADSVDSRPAATGRSSSAAADPQTED
jgi:cytochrome oxidase Cu insertion factor (SCO1/SenC/PrrC family)